MIIRRLSMEDCYCQGYVYSESKRIVIRWIVPIIILFEVIASFWLLRMAIIDGGDRAISLIAAFIFALLSIFMILGRKKALIILSLQYACSDNIIQNRGLPPKNSVDVKCSMFISQIYIAGITRAPWPEEFYLLSNEPMQYIPNHEGNGTLVVQSLTKRGVVILPINATTQSVIEQLTGNIVIPAYPKVAYIQRCD